MRGALIVLAFLASAFTTEVLAQTAEVKFQGMITDKGEPLAGATVILQGTSNGTFVRDDGTFNLEVNPPNDGPYVLIVRFVGKKQAQIEIASSSDANSKSYHLNYTSKKKYTVETSAK